MHIISGPDIFTNDKSQPFIKSGAILINNRMIEDVGTFHKLKSKYPHVSEEKYCDGLITPGFVNLHHHLYSSMARGWNPSGTPAANFTQVLDKIWWRLDKALEYEDIYLSAIIGLCDSLRMGITAVIDHHASQHNIVGSLEIIARAYQEIGLKGALCFEITDRGGKEVFEAGLKETIAALNKWPRFIDDCNLRAMVGLHASMTLSDTSLKTITEAVSSYDPGYHFHLAEDKSDQVDSETKYSMRIAERFAKYGIFGDNSLAIHGVHLNNDEIMFLKDTQTNLVMCPRSNQNNAVGIPHWWEYHGVNLGLGTDGIGSDIISEAKAGLYITHHEFGRPDFGFTEIINMLLNNNPQIFAKVTGHKVGKLSPGYPADFVLWNYDSPTPIDDHNFGGHLLYGLYNHPADTIWIDGRKLYDKGEFTTIDYAELMAKSREAAKKLWQRL